MSDAQRQAYIDSQISPVNTTGGRWTDSDYEQSIAGPRERVGALYDLLMSKGFDPSTNVLIGNSFTVNPSNVDSFIAASKNYAQTVQDNPWVNKDVLQNAYFRATDRGGPTTVEEYYQGGIQQAADRAAWDTYTQNRPSLTSSLLGGLMTSATPFTVTGSDVDSGIKFTNDYVKPAVPILAATTAAVATGGTLAPILGGGLIGGAVAGAAGGVAAGGVTNTAQDKPFFDDAGKNAAIGGVSGGLMGAVAPAASEGIQGVTGLGEQASNTIAGGVTSAGANAATQYATTGEVNPVTLGTSAAMGAASGYNTPTSVDLPGSAGYDPMYSDENFAPPQGLLSDGYNYTYADGSSTPQGGDYNTAEYRTQTTIPDADIAASFNLGTNVSLPYDKLIRGGLSLLGGSSGITGSKTSQSGSLSTSAPSRQFATWDKLADFKQTPWQTYGQPQLLQQPEDDSSSDGKTLGEKERTFGLDDFTKKDKPFGLQWHNYA